MRRFIFTLVAFWSLAAPAQTSGQVVPIASPLPAGITYLVNSTADAPDADVGNPACADASGLCTLRAAIMQANFTVGPNIITVPSGVYLLTRPGDDDGAVLGDLDVTDDLTIQGAGSANTIVDGNGAITHDRVFQILSSAKETSFSGLTIRAGRKISNTFDEGGGLLWEGGGGHLRLSHVTLEGNTARYGGGLYAEYSSAGGSLDLEDIIVRANTAQAAVGGLGASFSPNISEFVMRSSQVYSNTAYEGGGLYFQGDLALFGPARIEDSEIYSNTASLSGGFENHSGSAAVPVVLSASRIHNNQAGFYGGAIGNYGTLVISGTTLDANSATLRGGGLYDYEGGQVDIEQSTLSRNFAQTGGGIYSELFIHNNSVLTLTNSTLSGNIASRDGGGLYAAGGQVKLFNTTIASNQVVIPVGISYSGLGGGLYISNTTYVAAQNSLIGDNTHRYQALAPEADDCNGALDPVLNNLLETTTNCSFTVLIFANNIFSQDPKLGPLAFNGGATQTQALLAGSPAINAGSSPYCSDAAGSPLTVDQRGFRRPGSLDCDIGAFEYYPLGPFLPLMRR